MYPQMFNWHESANHEVDSCQLILQRLRALVLGGISALGNWVSQKVLKIIKSLLTFKHLQRSVFAVDSFWNPSGVSPVASSPQHGGRLFVSPHSTRLTSRRVLSPVYKSLGLRCSGGQTWRCFRKYYKQCCCVGLSSPPASGVHGWSFCGFPPGTGFGQTALPPVECCLGQDELWPGTSRSLVGGLMSW